MPGDRLRIYWDANCFLYYINNEPTWAPLLEYYLRRASDEKTIEIVTSVLTVTEVAFTAVETIGRVLTSDEEAKIDTLWQTEGVTLVEVNTLIARLARDLHRQRLQRGWKHPGAPDLIHMATAQFMQVSEMHTIEQGLHQYSTLIGLRVCFPPLEPPQMLPLFGPDPS